MGESARTRLAYDRVAEQYARECGDELARKPLDRALLDAFAELTGPGPVVDLGCGPGHVAAYLAARGVPVAGVDLSTTMCAVARRTRSVPVCAGDLTRLPLASGSVAGVVSLYAVIHLGRSPRAAAYRELARVLRIGGHALVAFHVSDADTAVNGSRRVEEWWGRPVDLTFRFLDPSRETRLLESAGLVSIARLDRAPHPGAEHASRRSYLLVRRDPPT